MPTWRCQSRQSWPCRACPAARSVASGPCAPPQDAGTPAQKQCPTQSAESVDGNMSDTQQQLGNMTRSACSHHCKLQHPQVAVIIATVPNVQQPHVCLQPLSPLASLSQHACDAGLQSSEGMQPYGRNAGCCCTTHNMPFTHASTVNCHHTQRTY